MRVLRLIGLFAAALSSVSAASDRQHVAVQTFLRDNGLSVRSRPSWDEKFAFEVRGTEQKPELVTASCPSRQEGRTAIQGIRFSYEADNRGEFGGDLNVRDGKGPARSIVGGNVHTLIPFGKDLYVFTGLDHLGLSYGDLDIVENFDSAPKARHLTATPEAPQVVALDSSWGGFLIVSSLSVSVVTLGGSLHVIMARHAFLPSPNSVLSMGEADILVGVCGGVAWIHAPWRRHLPPNPDPAAAASDEIPVVTYWTRQ